MGCPVLRYASANQAVQCLSGCPHDVGTYGIVFWFLQRFRAIFNQGQQNAFRETILNFAVNRVSYVLLYGMNECIHYAVSDLTWRQGVGVNRVQNRKQRLHVWRHKGALVTGRFTGDNGTFVGLGTGRWQRQYGTHRDRAVDVAAVGFQNFPRVDVGIVMRGSGDKLGAIQYGTTANGQQVGDFLFAGNFHRVHQRLVRWVWLNPAELQHVQTLQCAQHLVEHAGFFHAAAAVGNQHASVSGDLSAQVFDSAFTEQNAGRGMKIKIKHCSFPIWWVEKEGGEGSSPNDIIVVFVVVPLNAHSCDCLAHFSIALEKYVKQRHNGSVGKGIRSLR